MKNLSVYAGAALAVCLCAFSVAQEAQVANVSAAPSPAGEQTAAPAAPKGVEPMAISANSAEVQNLVLEGMTHLLTFGDMQAYYKFSAALKKDPDCLMAHWGLCMSLMGAGPEFEELSKQSYTRIKELAGREDCVAHERAYANTLALLLVEGPAKARDAWKVISESHKQDTYAALFYALMARDGYDAEGNPQAGQADAIKVVDELLKKNPHHHAALFMRALLEESAPQVSAIAVDAARKAVASNPESFSARHLMGHMQFRTGNYSGAALSFEKACRQSEAWEKSVGAPRAFNDAWFRSAIYRATAEFCHGNYEKARQLAEAVA